jgi:3-deoxy-D-manno-octulosonate 8-phosphate phosphatase (KDO 8-P phosphatase)
MKSINDVDFSKISFILMDMDGVLSDGSLFYLPDGHVVKIFHAHDGFGVVRGRELGLKFGIISGKTAIVNKHRAERLKIEEMYEGVDDKVSAYEEIRAKYNLNPENFCFIGDDVFDMPLLDKVAFSAAPPEAIFEVRESVHYITNAHAGKGCVRDVIDFILKKQGKI